MLLLGRPEPTFVPGPQHSSWTKGRIVVLKMGQPSHFMLPNFVGLLYVQATLATATENQGGCG